MKIIGIAGEIIGILIGFALLCFIICALLINKDR